MSFNAAGCGKVPSVPGRRVKGHRAATARRRPGQVKKFRKAAPAAFRRPGSCPGSAEPLRQTALLRALGRDESLRFLDIADGGA
jgi:hypothetical protein